ncbi:hypothetical protein FOZ60_009447 [Perkinsus olseni]|uniref:Multifunctional fusion protein n=1 Tax=Perkinsus olseni TaxID=32597 RepID=A0A7J6PCT9_PEROL|nr:hypothetical protein FOZ60_009447 [Perkinsus olseni]
MVTSSLSAITSAAVKGAVAAAPPMKVSTCDQMRRCDKNATDKYSIPSALLMENAGITSYRCLTELLPNSRMTPQTKVLVVCGPGNNGGDGFVVARYVHSNGGQVRVILLNSREKYHGDASTNLNIVDCIPGIPVEIATTEEAISAAVDWADVLVDGIFGTGLGRVVDPSSPFGMAIAAINRAKKPVMSLDIPSGVNGDSGRIMGDQAVHATATATFGLVKVGNLVYPGREMCGNLTVTHIGYPPELYADLDTYVNYFPPLPARSPAGHKGSFGKALFVAGAEGYYGAPMLSSYSFLKAGGGYSRLATVKSIIPVIAAEAPSIVFHELESTSAGSISSDNYDRVFKMAQDLADMVVVGPGVSTNGDTARLVRALVLSSEKPMVIDGDGLTAISTAPVDSTDIFSTASQLLQERHRKQLPPVVLTPHLAELSRLTGISMGELTDGSRSLLEVGRELAQKTNAVVVVKGATSMICEPSGRVRMNLSGNSGMGTAGSGDVLSGLIPAMYAAYGHEVDSLGDAVAAAVFVHGVAGDIAAINLGGEDGVTASDIMNAVPEAVSYVRGESAFGKYSSELESRYSIFLAKRRLVLSMGGSASPCSSCLSMSSSSSASSRPTETPLQMPFPDIRDSVEGVEQPRDQPPPLAAIVPVAEEALPVLTEPPPSLVAVEKRIKEVTEEIARLEKEGSLSSEIPEEYLAMTKVEITKPPKMKSLSESDLQIPRAKKAQPDEKVLARKALLSRIEKEVGEEIERQREEEIKRGIDLRARFVSRSRVWDIQVPRAVRDEHWIEPGPEVCRHALLGVLSGVISVTTAALPGRDGDSSGGAVYATVVTKRDLTEGYKKSLVRALSPYGIQAIVLSVESLRSLLLSQGAAMEVDQASQGRGVAKHRKKGKRGKRGRKGGSSKPSRSVPMPKIEAGPTTSPRAAASEVASGELEMKENAESPRVERPSPSKEASSRCDHFCISTPNDSEATGPGMEHGLDEEEHDDDIENEDDYIADAVGTWLGVDDLDEDHNRGDSEYLDQHGSPRARNAAATMTFFNSAATAFGFSKADGHASEVCRRCKLSNLRDSDKDRVARLVTTLAQQKKRAETEQRAREKAESSAERAVAEAERAKETLRRSLELLNRYHQRAKADLAERARLKACVAVSAPHPVEEVAREATSNSSSPARGGHERPLPSRSDATCGHPPYDDTPPSSRRTSDSPANSHTVKRRFSDMRAPRTLSTESSEESSEDEVVPERSSPVWWRPSAKQRRAVEQVVAGSRVRFPRQLGCSRHQRSLLRRYLQMSRDSEAVAIKSREERESDKVLRDFLSKSVEERHPKLERPTAGSEASKRAGPRPSTAAPRSEELENSAVLRSSISITASGDGKRVLRLQPPRSPRSSPRSPVGLADAPKSPGRCRRPRSPHASSSVTPKKTTISPGLGHDAERHSLEVFLKLNEPAGDRLPEAPIPRPALWQQPRSPLGREQPAEVTAHLAEVDDVLSALSFTESHSTIHSKIPLATERIGHGQIFR